MYVSINLLCCIISPFLKKDKTDLDWFLHWLLVPTPSAIDILVSFRLNRQYLCDLSPLTLIQDPMVKADKTNFFRPHNLLLAFAIH